MSFRNPKHNHFGGIDMEIEHPEFGWIPFTAHPDDTEAHGRELYEEALASAAPADTVPEPEVVMPTLTPRQLWLAALQAGVTKAAVLAAVELVEDPEEREYMRIELNEATSYSRHHPAVEKLALIMNMPESQIDTLWVWASTL